MEENPLAASPRGEWERIRRKYSELHLTPIGPDNLSWLIAGRPDPCVSRRYFDLVSGSFSKGLLSDAAQQLLEFFRRHTFTFHCSGWTDRALGAICLQDERAAMKFLNPYWSQVRKPLPKSTMAAFEALRLVEGKHRKHWLTATRWMRDFYARASSYRKADQRFPSEALKEYRKRPAAISHTCLTDRGLKAIAEAVANRPNASANALCDRALAIMFPKTSRSTIAHLRANVKKRLPFRP